jgi:hypothetical protein
MRERRSPSWKRFGDMARDSGRMTTGAAAFKLDPLPGVPREVQVSFLLWLTAVAAGVVETIIRAIDCRAAAGKRMSPASTDQAPAGSVPRDALPARANLRLPGMAPVRRSRGFNGKSMGVNSATA